MKKIKNNLPSFKNEDEERNFWATHSFADYADQFKQVKMDLSALKPSTRPITIRLPVSLIYDLKVMSNKRDVPYQSFVKTILADRVREEYAR
ncbi:MAG: BrnA antitoxin family protein [bacterium]